MLIGVTLIIFSIRYYTIIIIFRKPDLIIQVAHPSITEKYGEDFLSVADYMVSLIFIIHLKP